MVTPLSLANMTNPPTADDWNDTALAIANTLGLPTTAWQPGSVERVTFATVANVQQQSDVAASIMVQAGFLDFAASGFVTYTDATGASITVFVTPDPSNPAQNPTGALGWLDVLADSVYDVQRILTSPAGGLLAIVNTSVSTYGPFSSVGGVGGGTYHVAQASGPTYSNVAGLTIPPSTLISAVSSVADNGSGLIEVTIGSTAGMSDGDIVAILGVNGIPPLAGTTAWAVTIVNATQFTLNGSTFSGAYAGGGSVYTPLLAEFTADISGTGSNAVQNAVTMAVTSLAGVTVANPIAWTGADTESNASLANRCRLKLAALAVGQPGGALAYYALSAITLAPLLTPAQSLSSAITRALVTLDKLTGTAYVTIANASGGPGSPDVTVVQDVENAYAGVTANTITVRAAANHAVAVIINVFLPASYNTAANKALLEQAVTLYGQLLPIGGVTNPGGAAPNTNVVPYDAVLGAVWEAAKALSIPIQNVEGTIAGGTSNVQLLLVPTPEVAVFSVTLNLVSV